MTPTQHPKDSCPTCKDSDYGPGKIGPSQVDRIVGGDMRIYDCPDCQAPDTPEGPYKEGDKLLIATDYNVTGQHHELTLHEARIANAAAREHGRLVEAAGALVARLRKGDCQSSILYSDPTPLVDDLAAALNQYLGKRKDGHQ